MKTTKQDLRKNSVISDTFHIGIELELKIEKEEEDADHDDDACARSYVDSFSDEELLEVFVGIDTRRVNMNVLQEFFNFNALRDRIESEHECGDPDCAFNKNKASDDELRLNIEDELIRLTKNKSFKVVNDTSIDLKDNEYAAEVCWNYYASVETLRDNYKIMKYLNYERAATFDTSCGLHININNYMKLDAIAIDIPTSELDFLFNFVAGSRRDNQYCSEYAISCLEKYSMIYHQIDRFEFRFFSPTLNAEKLNHYVTLAHHVYKRLAGKDCKLPKKTERYLREKMKNVNQLSDEVIEDTIQKTNSLQSLDAIVKKYEDNEAIAA